MLFFYIVGVMTLSRSLFIASSVVLLYVLYDIFRKRLVLLLSILIPFSAFAFLVILSETRLLEFELSKNAGSSRINALIAGFVTIIENPIYATSETYLKNFELSCLQFKLGDCYSVISSHNGFVNVSEENTIFGLFILLTIIYYLYRYSLLFKQSVRAYLFQDYLLISFKSHSITIFYFYRNTHLF